MEASTPGPRGGSPGDPDGKGSRPRNSFLSTGSTYVTGWAHDFGRTSTPLPGRNLLPPPLSWNATHLILPTPIDGRSLGGGCEVWGRKSHPDRLSDARSRGEPLLLLQKATTDRKGKQKDESDAGQKGCCQSQGDQYPFHRNNSHGFPASSVFFVRSCKQEFAVQRVA